LISCNSTQSSYFKFSSYQGYEISISGEKDEVVSQFLGVG
jgi:hypothetical protein